MRIKLEQHPIYAIKVIGKTENCAELVIRNPNQAKSSNFSRSKLIPFSKELKGNTKS